MRARNKVIAAVAGSSILIAGCIDFQSTAVFGSSPASTARATGVAWADVANRGVDDAIVVTDDGRLVRSQQCGPTCWQTEETVVLGAPALSVAVADLNGDGIDDVLVGTTEGAAAYFGGTATPTRPAGLTAADSAVVATTVTGRTVLSGDFDGNGTADVAIEGDTLEDPMGAYPELVRVDGNGQGGFGAPVVLNSWISAGQFHTNPVVADIDGNGDDEVLVVTGHAMALDAILHAYGDDPVDSALNVKVGFVRDLVAGDLNGDGRGDVAVRTASVPPNVTAKIDVYCSTGSTYLPCGAGPTFTQLDTGSFGKGPMYIGDLDDDGRADLAALDPTVDRFSSWRGLADGGFARYQAGARIDHPTAAGPKTFAFEPHGPKRAVLVAANLPNAGVQYLENVSVVP